MSCDHIVMPGSGLRNVRNTLFKDLNGASTTFVSGYKLEAEVVKLTQSSWKFWYLRLRLSRATDLKAKP